MTNEFAVGGVIIKSSTVTRSQFDRKVIEIAKQVAIVQALRRENDRLRNWATGLAVLSAVLGLVIWAMILEFIVF
jgi:hypothetical protein|tara:strand:+ start:86 stop:310 length:225 start_codon:yes stop_codon:yes gene_type:complete